MFSKIKSDSAFVHVSDVDSKAKLRGNLVRDMELLLKIVYARFVIP